MVSAIILLKLVGRSSFPYTFATSVRRTRAGFCFPGMDWRWRALPTVKLDGVRAGIDEGFHDLRHVFDSLEETGLVEEAVIDRDIEAAVRPGVEETVEAVFYGEIGLGNQTPRRCRIV